jgi:hypothetical protein
MGWGMAARPGDRSYRVTGLQPYFMLTVLVGLTAFAPLVLWKALHGDHPWFDLIWLGILVWFWFNALDRVAYRIDLRGDAVEFRSIAHRRRTSLERIESITSRQGGVVTVRYEGGRVDLVGALDGLHDFISRVEAANPAVRLRGV